MTAGPPPTKGQILIATYSIDKWEFIARIEPFLHEPTKTNGGSGAREAATEILKQFPPSHYNEFSSVDVDWWLTYTTHAELSTDATRLGTWVLMGSEQTQKHPLNTSMVIDVGDMDTVDDDTFQNFVEEMVEVMEAGISKGYSQQLSHTNPPGWQVGEIRAKLAEFEASMRGGNRSQARRCLYKVATAAYVLYRDRLVSDHPGETVDEWC